jgi:carbon storage regulator
MQFITSNRANPREFPDGSLYQSPDPIFPAAHVQRGRSEIDPSTREEFAMLVLTRKINESITIGGGIEIVVVAVRGNRVRLGFRAPADVAVQRSECVAVGEDRHRMHPCVIGSEPDIAKPR